MKSSRIYLILVLLSLVSPFISLTVLNILQPNADYEFIEAIFFAIVGVPIIGVCGLVTSGLIRVLKLKHQNLSLLGYLVPAIAISIIIMTS